MDISRVSDKSPLTTVSGIDVYKKTNNNKSPKSSKQNENSHAEHKSTEVTLFGQRNGSIVTDEAVVPEQ